MSNEIHFVSGEFQEFEATTKFHLGKLRTDLNQGAVVRYDGQVLRMDGQDHSYPELRSTIKSGWLVPKGTSGDEYVPAPSGVKVRTPGDQGKIKEVLPVVTQDERAVSRIKSAGVNIPTREPFKGTIVKEESGNSHTVSTVQSHRTASENAQEADRVLVSSGRKLTSATTKTRLENSIQAEQAVRALENEIPSSESESTGVKVSKFSVSGPSQETKVIGKMASSAVSKTVLKNSGSVDQKIRSIDTSTAPKAQILTSNKHAGEVYAAGADDVKDIIGLLDPESRAAMLAEQRKAAVRASMAKLAEEEAKINPVTSAPVVMTMKTEVKEEEAVPEPTQETISGLKAKVVTNPYEKSKPKITQPRSVEEAILRDGDVPLAPGLTWNKNLHWRTRARIAVDKYARDPKSLGLIKNQEEPSVVKLIDEHMAKLSQK